MNVAALIVERAKLPIVVAGLPAVTNVPVDDAPGPS
jgi:hypothetical protein